MSKFCGECTYLDLSTGNSSGKYYCEKKWERHLATDPECGSFCQAYRRDYSTIKNAIDFSNEKTKSGCYLTTIMTSILGLSDNNPYLETIRSARTYMQKDERYKMTLAEYDVDGPKIGKALENDPARNMIALSFFEVYIKQIKELIDNKEYLKAIFLYMAMTSKLRNLYNIDRTVLTLDNIKDIDINETGHGYQKRLLNK